MCVKGHGLVVRASCLRSCVCEFDSPTGLCVVSPEQDALFQVASVHTVVVEMSCKVTGDKPYRFLCLFPG